MSNHYNLPFLGYMKEDLSWTKVHELHDKETNGDAFKERQKQDVFFVKSCMYFTFVCLFLIFYISYTIDT